MAKAWASLVSFLQKRRGAVLGFFALALLWRLCLAALGLSPAGHDPQDSYTLQALAWRIGLLHLPEDVPHLELAIYKGNYFVSFPPVPSLPMWLLSFFFGENTPNRLMNLCYFLSSYGVGYSLCRRLGKADGPAALWAVFLVAGCNLLNICWHGGVWYQAQALAFLFTLCAFRLLLTKRPALLAAGLCALALAIGCRPFQAVYIPPALYMAFRGLRKGEKAAPLMRTLLRLAVLCIGPGLIGLGYGLYNLARFDSFLEFGHTYLPEFQRYGSQFSLSYLGGNIANLLRLPTWEGDTLSFPHFSGFAFYLVNPLFSIALLALGKGLVRRRIRRMDGLLVLCLLAHFFLLLLHRTFGGWQFGARYLIDLCPALFLLTLRQNKKGGLVTEALMIFGVLFNLYGGLVFYLS